MIRRQLPAYTPQSPVLAAAALAGAASTPRQTCGRLRNYLGRRFGASQVVLTSSGTQALQLALQLATELHSKPRPIALPAFGCYDLITAAVGARTRVVFYDVDPIHLQPDPSSLRVALDAGVGVVVATPLYGFPLDWTWLRRECQAAGAVLIEDSAQGLGSEWDGVEGGSFGDATVLSFGRGKGWSGAGGGALLLRNDGLQSLVDADPPPAPPLGSSLKDFGASAALWLLGRPWLYSVPNSLPFLHLGVTTYKDPQPVVGPSFFAAASALRQADLAVQAVGTRRRWAAAWARLVAQEGPNRAVTSCRVLAGGASGYLRFPVLATNGAVAVSLLEAGDRAGVGPPYPKPLPELEAAEALAIRTGPMPGSVELARSLVTFPTHPRLEPRDLTIMESVLRDGALDGLDEVQL